MLLGVVPMILGRVVMFPLPGQPLPYYDPGTIGLNSTNNANPPLGGFEGNCKYEWCKYIPAVHIAQFMTGFVIATVSLVFFYGCEKFNTDFSFRQVGYPFCVALTGSMYSKLLVSSNKPVNFLRSVHHSLTNINNHSTNTSVQSAVYRDRRGICQK